MTATTSPLAVARAGERVHRGWIESPAFDLPLFVLSPLVGLAFLAIAVPLEPPQALLAQAVAFYFVAVPHYMSTYTFFLGDDNLRHYRSRRLAFFGGPALISLTVLTLWLLRFPPAIQAAVFIWNVWHVARQNSGILAMYRRLNGGDRSEHVPATYGILGVSAGMAFWNIERYPSIGRPLESFHPQAAHAFALLLLTGGVLLLIQLGRRLAARARPVAPQELGFLASSIVMFHPYLWVRDYSLATLGMLMGHFVQYLAIVWLLHRRKYGPMREGSAAQRVLARVSARYLMLGGFILASGVFFYFANRATAAIAMPSIYTVSWYAFTFIHFYLDGLIWAFSTPFVRESVGSYLMPASRVVV